jgi:hypothetical protein
MLPSNKTGIIYLFTEVLSCSKYLFEGSAFKTFLTAVPLRTPYPIPQPIVCARVVINACSKPSNAITLAQWYLVETFISSFHGNLHSQ